MNFWNWIWENLPFEDFLNPNKRIYWPYLLLCFFYAIIFIIFSKKKISVKGVGSWFSKSALVDYFIWIFNHFLQISVLPLVFANGLFFTSRLYHFFNQTFGYCTLKLYVSDWTLFWYVIIFVFVSDFSRYILHYLLHANQFLWSIHRFHHSAEVLTPLTLFRVHPFEMILFHIRYLLVYSVVTGGFLYLYNDFFEFPKIFGAGIFIFISNILGENLRHSNIPIGFGIFERLLISPKQHQMHHSTEQSLQQSNLGSFWAIWDVLFSTWKPSKGIDKIVFGIEEQSRLSVFQELIHPFVKLTHILKRKKE